MALTPRHSPASRPAHTRGLIAAALLALLLAQFGALWHAVVHGPVVLAGQHRVAHGADEHALAGSPCTEAHAAQQGTPADFGAPLALLPHSHNAEHAEHNTDHDAGSPVCQLFDQLLKEQASAAAGLPTAGTTWGHETPPAQPAPAPLTAAARAYEARAPPQA